MFTKQHLWTVAVTCVGWRSDYTLQQANGRYLRQHAPLTYEALRLHLVGFHTIGTYVTDEHNQCYFAVFDADDVGIVPLLDLQGLLASLGIVSYLEVSRRGGHLWVFLARACTSAQLRSWLLPYCPAQVEFYPKRDWATHEQPGSCIRLPFGVHRRSGERYFFVTLVGDQLVPVASSVVEALSWLATIERATVPQEFTAMKNQHEPTNGSDGLYRQEPQENQASTTHTYSSKRRRVTTPPDPQITVREWCLQQDPIVVIGRYVDLDARGLGCCPFGAHHASGKDRHPSLWVHRSLAPNIACWYCHTWKQGGSLFDFLSLYHGLSKKELWHRILSGEQF